MESHLGLFMIYKYCFSDIIVNRGTTYGSNEQLTTAKDEIHNGVQIPPDSDSTSLEQSSSDDQQTLIYNQFK